MTSIATFRSQFIFTSRYLIRLTIPCGGVFGLSCFFAFAAPRPLALMMNLQFAQIVAESFSVASLVGIVLLLIGVALATWYFPITVFESGLHAYDFWGKYHSVAWKEMISVRPRSMIGLKYVGVKLNDNSCELWIPRFLRDFGKFCELVREHAGEGHPLYRGLIECEVEK